MSDAQAVGAAAGFGQLLRRDASLVPAAIIAVAATAFSIVSPPAWLGRLPQAVVDVATGQRQELQQQLTTASAQSEQATKQLAEASTALGARDQTIVTQQQELTNLQSTVAARDAKLAEQEATTAAAVAAARQESAANLEVSRKALLASEQTAAQQAETIAALRQQAADSGARLSSLEAEQRSQAGLLANLTAERDRLRREALADEGRVVELEANLESLRAERDQLTVSLGALRTRLTAAAGNLAATEQTLAEREQALAERNATLDAQRGQLANLSEDVKNREATVARLTAELQAARAQSQGEAAAQLKAAEQAFAAREQQIAAQTRILTAERQQLEAERTRLTGEVTALGGERDRLTSALTAAQAQLADASAAAAAAEQTVASRDQALAARTGELETARTDSAQLQQDLATAQAQVQAKEQETTRLTRQSDALGDEVLRLAAVLGSAEAALQQQVEVGATQRTELEALLAGTVNQLSRYRSEFFAKLGTALGNRSDFTVVGDRFVVQSEILFASGSAELGDEGRTQLAKVGRTLLDVAPTIPASVPWVVRVDGHTDDVPIQSSRFASNWELSTARAISVVRFLIDQGVPAEHLAATGFGEYQPIAAGADFRIPPSQSTHRAQADRTVTLRRIFGGKRGLRYRTIERRRLACRRYLSNSASERVDERPAASAANKLVPSPPRAYLVRSGRDKESPIWHAPQSSRAGFALPRYFFFCHWPDASIRQGTTMLVATTAAASTAAATMRDLTATAMRDPTATTGDPTATDTTGDPTATATGTTDGHTATGTKPNEVLLGPMERGSAAGVDCHRRRVGCLCVPCRERLRALRRTLADKIILPHCADSVAKVGGGGVRCTNRIKITGAANSKLRCRALRRINIAHCSLQNSFATVSARSSHSAELRRMDSQIPVS